MYAFEKASWEPLAFGDVQETSLLPVGDLELLAGALCWRIKRISSGTGQSEEVAECLDDLKHLHVLLSQQRKHSQKKIIALLSTRGVGVAAVASDLKRQRLLEHHRGVLTVLDRMGVEAAACNFHAPGQSACGSLPGPQQKAARASAV